MAFFGLIGNRNRTRARDEKRVIDREIDNITGAGQAGPQTNPVFSTFDQVTRDIERIVGDRSTVVAGLQNLGNGTQTNAISFSSMEAIPLITEKPLRLMNWRNASAYPEVNFCLNEIADDFFHTDENGNFITVTVNPEKDGMNKDREEIIEAEFKRYMSYFNLADDGYMLVKRFLVEGELAWENIIDPEKKDRGITAVKFLPADYYELLVDKTTNNKVGIYFDLQKLKAELTQLVSTNYLNAYKIFNTMYGSTIRNYNEQTCIPLPWAQVTYISSEETTPDGMIPLSKMEICKQSYYQLAMMQDAAAIMRITRAPERLLFNVSTAGMPDKKAQDYVRNFANSLKQKNVAAATPMGQNNSPQGKPNITSVYDPVAMFENYVFGKSNQNDGTTVETIASTANFEQIEDLDYFGRRLLKQWKVPYSRYKTPENTLEKNDSITYEEYSFSREIIRLQKRFASGFKRGFITHLKLRDLWDKYDLRESDIDVQFTPPVLYDLYQTQKLVEAKMTTYSLVADREELSKITAMKTLLGYTDADVEENYTNLLKEGMLTKKVEWAQNQADEKGFADKKLPVPLDGDEPSEDEDEGGEGGGEEGAENTEEEETGGGEETGGEEGAGEEAGGEEAPSNVDSGDFGLG